MAKWVYMFTEGNANMRNLLGGKGANLAEMTKNSVTKKILCLYPFVLVREHLCLV